MKRQVAVDMQNARLEGHRKREHILPRCMVTWGTDHWIWGHGRPRSQRTCYTGIQDIDNMRAVKYEI